VRAVEFVHKLSTDICRFQLRRNALRVLSSSPSSYVAKPRTLTTFTSSTKVPRRSTAAIFQRRWATSEAEAKQEEVETPISEIQPKPEEEVENAIQSDNAAEAPVQAEAQSDVPETQGVVDSAVDAVGDAASNAATTVKETVRSATEFGNSRPVRPAREGASTPKPTIYIGNLFFDVTENDLVKELARFGTITKCRLMRDSRGLSKG
jgi:nucleolin